MTTTTPAVRTAASSSICSAPGCTEPIRPGQRITKITGQGWRHANCETAAGWWRKTSTEGKQP
jgi:hypothetical protein